MFDLSWAGTGWGRRVDYFSFPSLPTLIPGSSHLSEVHHLGKNVPRSPTFLCFKNFKMVVKHFIKKNWPSTKIDMHCRLHLSLLQKNIRTKMFSPSLFSLCPIFSSGSCDNRLRLVHSTWTCILSLFHVVFVHIFIQKELAEVDKYELYFARFR